MIEKVGFIGLGIMGKPMARNIINKGFKLVAYDVQSEAVKELEMAGTVSGTLSEIGEKCDVIITCLPNGKILQDVLFGEGNVCSTIKSGAIVIDHSSITPGEAKECARRLKKMEVQFFDAPVSGGEPKAITGELAIMVGGDKKAFEEIKPLLFAVGTTVTLVGEVGSGSVTKLVNQIIVNLNIAVLSEGLVFAEKAGVDPLLVYEAVKNGLAGSAVMDAKAPLITSRNFKPGGKISINHKDIGNVLSSAREMDIPLPLTSQLFEIMQTLKVMNCFDDDHGAIVKYFERLAGVEVGLGKH